MKKRAHWYQKVGRKHITAFLLPEDCKKLRELAAAEDKSLTRYVTRLLEKHVKEAKERGPGPLR